MTGKSARKRRPKRKAWSRDDFVDAVLEYVEDKFDIDRSNAVRLLIGRPLARGLINSRMLTNEEVTAFKAWLFDMLWYVYGGGLFSGLRLMSEQKRRGQKGAAKRKEIGTSISVAVIKLSEEIRRTGRIPDRNIAGVIANKTGKHPSYVRRILRRARQTQG